MRSEFMIERQGKTFVLYAGLLDAAHNAGLKAIYTELVQVPTPENGMVAICKANAAFEEVDDMSPAGVMREKRFDGIGDASPESVGKMIVPHIIRMAETRAKARCLRDALNVHATALEELGGDEPPSSPSPGVSEPLRAVREQVGSSSAATSGSEASDKQKGMIRGLLLELNMDIEEFEENNKVDIDKISKARASKAIDWLQKQKEAG